MNKNEQTATEATETTIQPTDEIVREFLLGELIKASTKRFKDLAVPFNKLTQEEQETLLSRMADDVREVVKTAVRVICSDNRINFRAEVESVTFKDGVKAVLTMPKTKDAHDMADAEGSTVMIVIEDGGRYLALGNATEGEPNQKPLFDQCTEGTSMDTTDKPDAKSRAA